MYHDHYNGNTNLVPLVQSKTAWLVNITSGDLYHNDAVKISQCILAYQYKHHAQTISLTEQAGLWDLSVLSSQIHINNISDQECSTHLLLLAEWNLFLTNTAMMTTLPVTNNITNSSTHTTSPTTRPDTGDEVPGEPVLTMNIIMKSIKTSMHGLWLTSGHYSRWCRNEQVYVVDIDHSHTDDILHTRVQVLEDNTGLITRNGLSECHCLTPVDCERCECHPILKEPMSLF